MSWLQEKTFDNEILNKAKHLKSDLFQSITKEVIVFKIVKSVIVRVQKVL